MSLTTLKSFLGLETEFKKPILKIYVASRNGDGSYKVFDATGTATLTVERETKDDLSVGTFWRVIRPHWISQSELQLNKESKCYSTSPFGLGMFEEVKEDSGQDDEIALVEEKKEESGRPPMNNVLLEAKPNQVSILRLKHIKLHT